jgi:ATP-binding cassette subfamily F protein 3
VPGAGFSEQQARDLAGAFLFSGNEQEKQLKALSGGERARAVLAGLIASAKNVMVMDEPTNHLDIPSSERLEGALLPPDEEEKRPGYEGVLLLISHDRALIDATCDHLLILDGKGGVEAFTGNYSEWNEKHQAKLKLAAAGAAEEKARVAEQDKRRKQQEAVKAEAAKAREQAKPVQQSKPPEKVKKPSNPLSSWSVERLDERIKQIEARIKQIDVEMGSADVWRDPARCDKLGAERTRLAAELEPLEYEYLARTS